MWSGTWSRAVVNEPASSTLHRTTCGELARSSATIAVVSWSRFSSYLDMWWGTVITDRAEIAARNINAGRSRASSKNAQSVTGVLGCQFGECMVRRRTARGLKKFERIVRVNVSGLFVENRSLRALDDDAHVSVLINRSVTRDAFSPPGFPTRRWTVLSSPSLLRRPLVESSSN